MEQQVEQGIITRTEAEILLSAALDLGERVLICGGEVSRVEDTITRILCAYGAEKADVLTITSSIVVTVSAPGWGILTQTRRVNGQQFNMEALIALNDLSRRACATRMPPAQIVAELKRIDRTPCLGFWPMLVVWAVTSASFSMFFGGNCLDAVFSAMVGILLKCLQTILNKVQLNNYFMVILCSMTGGILASLPRLCGLPVSPAAISIGNIMLLIPGISLTNALRDMFSGDTISGLLRCAEAIVLSLAIAWGFATGTAGTGIAGMPQPMVGLVTAFTGTVGFGLVFNVRGRNLAHAALCGAISWAVVLFSQMLGASELEAFLLSAMCVTICAEVLARQRHCPVTVFLVLGIIPLVPGGSLYRTMRFAIDGDWPSFASQGLQTMLYAIFIAAGIICVTALADVLKRVHDAAI